MQSMIKRPTAKENKIAVAEADDKLLQFAMECAALLQEPEYTSDISLRRLSIISEELIPGIEFS